MTWEAWLAITTIALCLVAMVRNWAGPDTVFLAALTLLITVGEVTCSEHLPGAADAVSGFANPGLLTVAVLFVVVAGLAKTGAMSMLTAPLLGRPRSVVAAQSRVLWPAAGLSAFLNNTPIVALFIPVITDWCKKINISPSKLLLPLSYATILGGMCTLIGTSTNLVVYGMVQEAVAGNELKDPGIGMFTIAWVGVPAAVVGIAYLLVASRWLLKPRVSTARGGTAARQYTVEMRVDPSGAVAGRSIEQAGLRHLPGVFLAEIERQGERIVAPGPEFILRGDDQLIFVGIVDSVVDLQKIRGLVPAADQVFKLDEPRPNRCLVEAVVSTECPLVGKSIREGRFRTRYNAVVIAVHRGGEHLAEQKIGDIVLRAGDTLLIETHPRFVDAYRNSHDFYLVSSVANSEPLRYDRAWIAIALLAGMVVAVTAGWLSMLNAALLTAGLMVFTGCCSPADARSSIDWRLLLAIGAALGVGKALKTSGAAGHLADRIITAAGDDPRMVLVAVYFTALLFTELITNNAAAVLVFPIAQAAAMRLGVDFTPFAVVVMVGASAGFATPIGYQTNLMVYGAGGYRFSDYLRLGLPLNLIVMVITVLLAPLVWPMRPV